jgi:hypothetical protein
MSDSGRHDEDDVSGDGHRPERHIPQEPEPNKHERDDE